jgi:biopolymer transport protein ExbD
MMRLPDDTENPAQINIVPMIDVIFAILTFFIFSTLYLTRSEGLAVNLPKAGTAKNLPPALINVTISSNGQIALNRQLIALEKLPDAVSSIVGKKKEALVVINADTKVAHGRVISVMDRLNQIPGIKLALAADKK